MILQNLSLINNICLCLLEYNQRVKKSFCLRIDLEEFYSNSTCFSIMCLLFLLSWTWIPMLERWDLDPLLSSSLVRAANLTGPGDWPACWWPELGPDSEPVILILTLHSLQPWSPERLLIIRSEMMFTFKIQVKSLYFHWGLRCHFLNELNFD